MRVGLNATCFNDRPSGAKQRFLGIYGALIRATPEIEYMIYEPVDCAVGQWFADAPNVTRRPTPVPSSGRLRKARAGLGFWRRQLRRDRLDLFEIFNLPMIAAPDCPTILTIHDARHVHDEVPSPFRQINKLVWSRALSRAARVITVSEAMKAEILGFRSGTKVTTIYNGIDPALFGRCDPAEAEAEAVRQRFGIKGDFALAVGHLEPRKNYPVAIEAFAELKRRGSPLQLLIVGNDGGSGPEIRAQVAAHGLEDSVLIFGNVGDEALHCLYALCRLVLFPSLYEGFGIPVLEAMASHRPLVVSDTPVFRELMQGHGLYFAHDDPVACADRIEQLLAEPATEGAIVDYGRRRIEDFSFDVLAAQVARLHARLTAR